MAGKGWSRPEDPERQNRETRRSNRVETEIISELSGSAGDKVRTGKQGGPPVSLASAIDENG